MLWEQLLSNVLFLFNKELPQKSSKAEGGR
jgi:hypothetical protein